MNDPLTTHRVYMAIFSDAEVPPGWTLHRIKGDDVHGDLETGVVVVYLSNSDERIEMEIHAGGGCIAVGRGG